MATESNIKSDTSEICAGCKKSSTSLSQPLKRCSRCKEVFYCSRECQKSDWKSHKKSCNKTPRPSLSRDGIDLGGNGFDGFSYYNTVAHTIPAAQELAKKLNISLPTGGDGEQGMALPLRRLITTGLDTLENLRLLFGPSWQPDSDYEEERLNILIQPTPRSPSYVMYSVLDDISSSLPWSPRPADEKETKKLQEVRDMQDLIRRHLGDRKQPTGMDMQCILQSFGAKWSEKLAVYQTAVNTMDQGVEPIQKRMKGRSLLHSAS